MKWQIAWDWRDTLGISGAAGCALLVASAALYVGAIEPQRAAHDAVVAQAQELQARYRTAQRAAPGGRPGIEEQLRTFYGFFPPLEAAPDSLARIFTVAEQEGLKLQAGEYRIASERGSRLARYQITLPVRGSYPQIRRFVAGVLSEVPPSALDDIVLKRESVSDQNLEARIRITLFLGGAQ